MPAKASRTEYLLLNTSINMQILLTSLHIQSNPAISKSQGKWKKKFEIAGFRNNPVGIKCYNNEFLFSELQYGKRH